MFPCGVGTNTSMGSSSLHRKAVSQEFLYLLLENAEAYPYCEEAVIQFLVILSHSDGL